MFSDTLVFRTCETCGEHAGTLPDSMWDRPVFCSADCADFHFASPVERRTFWSDWSEVTR